MCSGIVIRAIIGRRNSFIDSLFSVLSILVIIYMTLFNRNSEAREIILIPFNTIADIAHKPEAIRIVVMNVFLFFPLGLFLPFAIAKKIKKPVAVTLMFAVFLSYLIEIFQFILCVGVTEIDDVIFNMTGTFLGSLAYQTTIKAKMAKGRDV